MPRFGMGCDRSAEIFPELFTPESERHGDEGLAEKSQPARGKREADCFGSECQSDRVKGQKAGGFTLSRSASGTPRLRVGGCPPEFHRAVGAGRGQGVAVWG